jgi:uncharacterized damage-inducible protein DinB
VTKRTGAIVERRDVRSLVAAWRTTNRATTYLVEQLPSEIWEMPVPGTPRKTVRDLVAHVHNSRCRWIRALGPKAGIAMPRLVDPRRVKPREVARALARSSAGIVALLEWGAAHGWSVPRAAWQNFPTDLDHFLAYFVAHEAHHRGQLSLVARQLGRPLPREVMGGLWQWTRLARE